MNQPYYKKILSNQKLKNLFIYGVGQGINIVTPLLITPYLIMVCGLNNLGLIAIAQSLAFILCVVVDFSSYIIGVREVSLNRDQNTNLEKTFVTHLTSKVPLLFLTGLVILMLIWLLPYLNDNSTVILFSFPILVAQFLNPTWFFQGIEAFKWISFLNILSKLLFVTGVFIFVQQQNDFILVNVILGTSSFIANLIGFLVICRKFKFSFHTLKVSEVARLLRKDFPFCFSQLLFAVRNYSSVIIIGFFAGDFVAGQFKVIEQIINLLRTHLQLFFKFSYSYICLEIDRSLTKGLRIWRLHNGLNLLFTSFLVLLALIFAEPILMFFKVSQDLILDLENYLHLALVIPLLIGITLPMEQLIFSFNKNREYIKTTIFITLFHVIGVSVIIYWFNSQSVFAFLIATELLLIAIYYKLLHQRWSVPK